MLPPLTAPLPPLGIRTASRGEVTVWSESGTAPEYRRTRAGVATDNVRSLALVAAMMGSQGGSFDGAVVVTPLGRIQNVRHLQTPAIRYS